MASPPGFLSEAPALGGDGMDALSEVLRATRLKGGVFLHGELSYPWCMGVRVLPESCAPFLGETAEVIPYHYVLDGQLRLKLSDGAEYALSAGEVVMLPHNDYHAMGGDLTLPPIPSAELVQRPVDGGLLQIKCGGGGALTRIVCGFLAGERLEDNPVVRALPAVLQVDYGCGVSAEWMRSTFRYAADEIAAGRMGSDSTLAKLSELLFIEAIRAYAERLPEGQTGWLAGLKDPYVSRALALLHARLCEPWTVEALGREIGLSRSALSERFARVIGMPPMQYLTKWRIQMAGQELLSSSKSIDRIADDVGYESEASLSRAFRRIMGVPPATWRRQQQQQQR